MRTAGAKVAITLCIVLSAVVSMAQSLGDVARQERERRSQISQHARVLTNEDLQQERILPTVKPEDQPVVSHARTDEAMSTNFPAEQSAVVTILQNTPMWGVADQPEFSLGAYARALREDKSRRQQSNAAATEPVRKITNESLAEMLPPAGKVKRPAENQKQEPATEAQITDPGRPLIRATRGDSLWKLARIHLGDGRLWPVLWDSNPEIRNPRRLAVGQLLRLPVQELNFARVKMHPEKAVTAKRNTPVRTASAPQTHPAKDSSVQAFDLVRYLPARVSTLAVAGLATFVKPSAYPTR